MAKRLFIATVLMALTLGLRAEELPGASAQGASASSGGPAAGKASWSIYQSEAKSIPDGRDAGARQTIQSRITKSETVIHTHQEQRCVTDGIPNDPGSPL